MSLKKIDDKMICSYVIPGVEVLRATLKGLNLRKSLNALFLFQEVFVAELKERYHHKNKSKIQKHES